MQNKIRYTRSRQNDVSGAIQNVTGKVIVGKSQIGLASASESLDLGFISQVESHQKTLKMVFIASLLGAQQNKDSVKNMLASLLVVSLGKTLNRTPLSLCGRQIMWPSSLPVVVARV